MASCSNIVPADWVLRSVRCRGCAGPSATLLIPAYTLLPVRSSAPRGWWPIPPRRVARRRAWELVTSRLKSSQLRRKKSQLCSEILSCSRLLLVTFVDLHLHFPFLKIFSLLCCSVKDAHERKGELIVDGKDDTVCAFTAATCTKAAASCKRREMLPLELLLLSIFWRRRCEWLRKHAHMQSDLYVDWAFRCPGRLLGTWGTIVCLPVLTLGWASSFSSYSLSLS